MESQELNGAPKSSAMALAGMVRELSEISAEKVFAAIEIVTGYTKESLISKLSGARKRELVEARQIFCHILREHTDMSLDSIGQLIKRDHATVLYSLKNVSNLIETDKEFRNKYAYVHDAVTHNISIYHIKSKEIDTVGSAYTEQSIRKLVNKLYQ
jgi:chromosomal replication initiator protein